MMKVIENNFDIHLYRLALIVNHSDHVTIHQYALIHANVPGINAYMNAVMSILDLVVFHASVSANTLVPIVYSITLNMIIKLNCIIVFKPLAKFVHLIELILHN